MNETELEQDENLVTCSAAVSCPESVISQTTESFADVKTGMGEDMSHLLAESKVERLAYEIPAGIKEEKPLAISFAYHDGERLGNTVDIKLCKDSELTVVMDHTSEAGKGLAAVQTRIIAGENARLRLVQIERLGKGFDCMNDVGAYCDENASVELVQLVLGADNVWLGAHAQLAGKSSDLNASIGYQVTGSSRLDMNYVALHEGKKTTSHIEANGVLRESAKKLFRGTIDFKKGAAGAKGDELEDVLLLDDSVQNQTIPLILCAEEDVEGNHGASIGGLDENVMFYLESRGVSEAAAYELMAAARLKAVCRKIPIESLREELAELLDAQGALDAELS